MKTYRVEIPEDIVARSFERALSYPEHSQGTFFHDLRRAFKAELEAVFVRHDVLVNKFDSLGYVRWQTGTVVEKDAIINKYNEKCGTEFCAKYGFDDYSLKAINYTDRGYCELPSLLPFARVEEFSVGNIAVLVSNEDSKIELETPGNIKIAGYSYHIASRKKKSYICLLGICFDKRLISPILEEYFERCPCPAFYLDEIQVGFIHYPMIFICRACGQLFTCKCFESHFEVGMDIIRLLPYGGGDPELREHVSKIKIRDKICHLCCEGIPAIRYGSPMYFSPFLQRLLPYFYLVARKKYGRDLYHPMDGDSFKKTENELRERFGIPTRGDKRVSETILYQTVKRLFKHLDAIFHYRGKELAGLELDIWIPALRLGIEHQGKQHFEPVRLWGGSKELEKRICQDERKRALCKTLGYTLVEFTYREEITLEAVRKKLAPFLEGR